MRWTPEADEALRQGIAEKLSAKEIAARIGAPCKDRAVFARAHKLGLSFDVQAWRERVGRHARSERTRRLVSEANKRRFAQPGAREEVSARFKRLFADPDYAEANRQKVIAWCNSPEGRAQRSQAAKLKHAERLRELRPEYWPTFRALKNRGFTAAERLELCLNQQRLDDARRQREAEKQRRLCDPVVLPFEEQLRRVATGKARIVEVATIKPQQPDRSLIGSSLHF